MSITGDILNTWEQVGIQRYIQAGGDMLEFPVQSIQNTTGRGTEK